MANTLTFLSSEYPDCKPENAFFHVIPVPLEKSVSYASGTKNGPSAILEASFQLEAWEHGVFAGKYGIATLPEIDCSGNIESVLNAIETCVDHTLALNACPVLLGGEHTVSLGALRALAKRGRGCGLVQIDAHADLRKSYEGSPYSHACVMYRACHDLHFQLAQFGIREFCEEEVRAQKEFHVIAHSARELYDHGLPNPILPDDFPHDIYISFDLDGLDASLMPATGTPSPGGLFWHEMEVLLEKLAQTHSIIGFDVVELAPLKGLHSCEFTAAKIVHLLMALSLQGRKKRG